jgi:PAS domain S-box-containing protein
MQGVFHMTKPVQIPPAALEAILDNVPIQIWQVSYDCTYGRVNAAHAAFFGKTRDQIENQPVELVLPQPEASTAITKIRNAFETKRPVEYEQWLTDSSGNRRLLRVCMTPTTDATGLVQSLSCTAEDITLIRELEHDLKICREGADEEAQQKICESVDVVWGAVSSLVHMAETMDEGASQHLKRLSESCRVVASVLSFNSVYSQNLDYNFIHMLQQACLLHDIGKSSIPDSILLKPEKLTREEFDEVKKHTTIGAETLEHMAQPLTNSGMYKMAMDIALSHHERWDGKGYPNGLKGDEIPLSAQIVAICDVYDALRSVRPYKPALPHEVSMVELRRECGTQFNPALCDAFFHCAEEIRHIYDAYQGK